jgi:L-iditol 2-dehydrogenase
MRVAMYYRNSDVRLEELPRPEIGPGELLVQVRASGICGSDLLEWYRIKKAPIVLGHEISGTIAEVGEGVSQFREGDRVVVSHHVPCNTCRYCLAGQHTVCHTLHTTTFDPGGFSEYVRVPPINTERGTFRLPEELSFDEGAFGEPLACVVRGQRMARLQPGQCVLVVGSGISGLLHVLVARALGAGRVLATDVREANLQKARELGAHAALHASEDVPARVREENGGRPADLVIICTEPMAAFQQGLRSVDRGGTVLCFATTQPGTDLPIPINDFWRNSVTVMTSYANSPHDMEVALELMRCRRVDVRPLTSHRLGLEETGRGFALMAEGRAGVLKVLVQPWGPEHG